MLVATVYLIRIFVYLLRCRKRSFSLQVGHCTIVDNCGFRLVTFNLIWEGSILLTLEKKIGFWNMLFELTSSVSFSSFIVNKIDRLDLNYFFE